MELFAVGLRPAMTCHLMLVVTSVICTHQKLHLEVLPCPALLQVPHPFYLIGTRDSFTHHLVPLRCPGIRLCSAADAA